MVYKLWWVSRYNSHSAVASHVLQGLGTVTRRLSEPVDGVHHGVLSDIQVRLFHDRCSNPDYWTYAPIRAADHITRDEAVRPALLRIACGLFWQIGMEGGRDRYLSLLNMSQLRGEILERAAELNCITRRDALVFAFDLALRCRRIAVMLLEAANLEIPDEFLSLTSPLPEWLNNIAQELDLKICAPQELEAARRCFCNYGVISFFIHFQSVIEGRNPRLVFNMEDMQLLVRKRFRGLTGPGHPPLTKAETKLPHVTQLCTISVGGVVFKSIIILKNLKSLKSLVRYTALTSFAFLCSCWIAGGVFTMFAIDFCSQLSLYRFSFPEDIADQPVLLLLDAPISPRNITALMIFYLFNVDILVISRHTTDVLQPFDVGIAAPLKAEFKQELPQEINSLAAELTDGQRTKTDALRCHMVAAFLNVFHKVMTPGNLYSAFAATGFIPFSPTRPLDSPFVVTAPPGVFE
jgi:hypothetical protein